MFILRQKSTKPTKEEIIMARRGNQTLLVANSPTGARSQRGNVVNRSQNGIPGTAENGESLRRKPGESMGAFTKRTGGMAMGPLSKS